MIMIMIIITVLVILILVLTIITTTTTTTTTTTASTSNTDYDTTPTTKLYDSCQKHFVRITVKLMAIVTRRAVTSGNTRKHTATSRSPPRARPSAPRLHITIASVVLLVCMIMSSSRISIISSYYYYYYYYCCYSYWHHYVLLLLLPVFTSALRPTCMCIVHVWVDTYIIAFTTCKYTIYDIYYNLKVYNSRPGWHI